MNIHKNAHLTPLGREHLVQAVLGGQAVQTFAWRRPEDGSPAIARRVRRACRTAPRGRTAHAGPQRREPSSRSNACAASPGSCAMNTREVRSHSWRWWWPVMLASASPPLAPLPIRVRATSRTPVQKPVAISAASISAHGQTRPESMARPSASSRPIQARGPMPWLIRHHATAPPNGRHSSIAIFDAGHAAA